MNGPATDGCCPRPAAACRGCARWPVPSPDWSGRDPAATVLTQGTTEVADVLVDPSLLQRVIANLVTNAVRHTRVGKHVLVSASALGDRVELRVIDRGPGLPAEDRDRMFEPFQRLGGTDNTTGLGLALSRGLTEAMGGTLTPEDTPGGGLTMVLSVPMAQDRPQVPTDLPETVTS